VEIADRTSVIQDLEILEQPAQLEQEQRMIEDLKLVGEMLIFLVQLEV
jgi:hypothetical protein